MNIAPDGLRPSQIMSWSGPGSLVHMRGDSVLIMGIDAWDRTSFNYKEIYQPQLAARLGVTRLFMPIHADDSPPITCRSFPRWGVCPKCDRMHRHADGMGPGETGYVCGVCGIPLYPAYIVAICDLGHLDDFPWWGWAHSRSDEPCDTENDPDLLFRAKGTVTSLADYEVICRICGASRNCADAMRRAQLAKITGGCTGQLPWLGKSERCSEESFRGVQARSHSVYYPVTVSALQVGWSGPIQDVITTHAESILALRRHKIPVDKIVDDVGIFGDVSEYGADKIRAALEARLEYLDADYTSHTEHDEIGARRREYFQLVSAVDGKYTQAMDMQLTGYLEKYLERLLRLDRLVEVRAIRGFMRGAMPDPFHYVEDDRRLCRISRKADWRPAVESRGEGILFSLNSRRLYKWERLPSVGQRCRGMIGSYRRFAEQSGWHVRDITPRHILLHTLSHAVTRTLASLSGYGEASIRERLYTDDGNNGILLYTASPSTDGSLGGLARQGGATDFELILKTALQRCETCSRDPLCAQSHNENAADPGMNGSACYSCALLPETSCEVLNCLLDRQLLVDPNIGFFSDGDEHT